MPLSTFYCLVVYTFNAPIWTTIKRPISGIVLTSRSPSLIRATHPHPVHLISIVYNYIFLQTTLSTIGGRCHSSCYCKHPTPLFACTPDHSGSIYSLISHSRFEPVHIFNMPVHVCSKNNREPSPTNHTVFGLYIMLNDGDCRVVQTGSAARVI